MVSPPKSHRMQRDDRSARRKSINFLITPSTYFVGIGFVKKHLHERFAIMTRELLMVCEITFVPQRSISNTSHGCHKPVDGTANCMFQRQPGCLSEVPRVSGCGVYSAARGRWPIKAPKKVVSLLNIPMRWSSQASALSGPGRRYQ